MVAPLQWCSATTSGASVGATFSTANLSTGTKLIALVSYDSGIHTPLSVSDGTNSFTQLIDAAPATTTSETLVFVLDTPAGKVGTKPTITFTTTGGGEISILVLEVPGLAPGVTAAAIIDGTAGISDQHLATNATPFTTPSPAYSSSVVGNFLLSVIGDDGDNDTYSANGAGFSAAVGINASSTGNILAAWRDSTGGAESCTWTAAGGGGNTTGYQVILLAFKLAALPTDLLSPPVPPRLFHTPFGLRFQARPNFQGAVQLFTPGLFVQGAGVDSGTVNVGTLLVGTVAAGNTILVGLRRGLVTVDTVTVTDNVNPGNYIMDAHGETGDPHGLYIFRMANTLAGATTITATLTGVAKTLRFVAAEYTGNLVPDVATVFGFASSGAQNSGNLTSLGAADAIIGVFSDANVSTTWTLGGGFTLRQDPMPNHTIILSDMRTVQPPGTYAAAATLGTSQAWGAIVAAYKASTGVIANTAGDVRGQGGVTAQPSITRFTFATLGGEGQVTAAPTVLHAAFAAVGGRGVVTAAPIVVKATQAAIGGRGGITAAPVVNHVTFAAIGGRGVVTAAPIVVKATQATIGGSGRVTVAPTVTRLALADAGGREQVTASPGVFHLTQAVPGGIGRVTASPSVPAPSTITTVGASSVSSGATTVTTLNLVLPAGIQGGDLIQIGVMTSANVTLTLPTGFTAMGSLAARQNMFLWKYAAGSVGSASTDAGATVALSWSGARGAVAASIVHRGVDQTTWYTPALPTVGNATHVTTSTGAGVTANTNTVTPAVNAAMLVGWAQIASAANATSIVPNITSGTQEVTDHNSPAASFSYSIAVYDLLQTTAAAATWAFDATDQSWTGYGLLYALKPGVFGPSTWTPAADISGHGGITAAPSVIHPSVVAVGGRGLVTASATKTQQIVASGASVSTGSAAMVMRYTLAASGASVSSGTMDGEGIRTLGGTGASVSTGTAAVIDLYQLAASGASTSTGTAAIVLRFALVASGTSTSTGSLAVLIPNLLLVGAGASVSTGVGAVVDLYVLAATGASVSTGSLNVIISNLVLAASGASVSTGTAAALLRYALVATGASVSSGVDNTLIPFLILAGSGASVSVGSLAFGVNTIAMSGVSISSGSIAGLMTYQLVGSAASISSGTGAALDSHPLIGAGASSSTGVAGVIQTYQILGAGASTSNSTPITIIQRYMLAASGSSSSSTPNFAGLVLYVLGASGASVSVGSLDATTTTGSKAIAASGASVSSGTFPLMLQTWVLGATGASVSAGSEDVWMLYQIGATGASVSSGSEELTHSINIIANTGASGNVLSTEDSDFEGATVGTWTALINATLTNTGFQKNTGTRSLKALVATTGFISFRSGSYPIGAGQPFIASGFTASAHTLLTKTATLWLYFDGLDPSTAISGTPVTVPGDTGTWGQISVSGVVPNDPLYAGTAYIVYQSSGTSSTSAFFLDTVSFAYGSGSVSAGSMDLTDTWNIGGTGASTSSGSLAATIPNLQLSASGQSVSSGTANIYHQYIPIVITGASTSSGTANVSNVYSLKGVGASVSSGGAAIAIPVTPMIALGHSITFGNAEIIERYTIGGSGGSISAGSAAVISVGHTISSSGASTSLSPNLGLIENFVLGAVGTSVSLSGSLLVTQNFIRGGSDVLPGVKDVATRGAFVRVGTASDVLPALTDSATRRTLKSRTGTEILTTPVDVLNSKFIHYRSPIEVYPLYGDTAIGLVVHTTSFQPPKVTVLTSSTVRVGPTGTVTLTFSFNRQVTRWSVRLAADDYADGSTLASYSGAPVSGGTTTFAANLLQPGTNDVAVFAQSASSGAWTV